MLPASIEDLKRSKLQLERLVDLGPAPSREGIRIAESLLDTLADGFPLESRVGRLTGLLRGQFTSWFAEGQLADPQGASRQRNAILGAIGQLVELVAAQVIR